MGSFTLAEVAARTDVLAVAVQQMREIRPVSTGSPDQATWSEPPYPNAAARAVERLSPIRSLRLVLSGIAGAVY